MWARVSEYRAEPSESNQEDPLEGYCQGTLRRRDLKTLEEGGGLTGDIINEVGRRISASAPHVAFLDSIFLYKVAPINCMGSKFMRQF